MAVNRCPASFLFFLCPTFQLQVQQIMYAPTRFPVASWLQLMGEVDSFAKKRVKRLGCAAVAQVHLFSSCSCTVPSYCLGHIVTRWLIPHINHPLFTGYNGIIFCVLKCGNIASELLNSDTFRKVHLENNSSRTLRLKKRKKDTGLILVLIQSSFMSVW